MPQPPGFIDPQHSHHMYKLHKSLYGFKQALQAQYDWLCIALCSQGFHKSQVNTSLFLLHYGMFFVWWLVDVDNILIIEKDSALVDFFIKKLHHMFTLKDLGPIFYFLEVEVLRNKEGMHLTQICYIQKLLQQTYMSDCKSSPSPTSFAVQLIKDSRLPMQELLFYRGTIDALQYLSLTLLGISFMINKLSQFMQNPMDIHWATCKHVLQYLQSMLTHRLHLRVSFQHQL